jgi:hypothetical protein
MNKRLRTTRARILTLTLATLVVMATAAPTRAAPFWLFYKFTPISDTNGLFFTSLTLFPAISNSGRVAWRGNLTGGVEGVFTRLGTGGINTLADTGLGEFRFFGITASMNNNDQVLFFSQFQAGNAEEVMLRGSGNSATPMIDSGGPFRGFVGFEMNDAGTFVLGAKRDNGNEVVLIKGSGSPQVVAEIGSLFMSVDRAPSINNTGKVAFTASRTSGVRGIFARQGASGDIGTVIDDGSPWVGFTACDINDAGTVAFIGTRDTLNRGVYRTTGGTTITIAEGGQLSQEFNGFSMNNSGRVAYQRGPTFGGAIFLGPDIFKRRVIGNGDFLFGRTVASALLDRGALNDQGQLAVSLSFTDGSNMIVRVDPIVPPFVDIILASSVMQLSTGSGSGMGVTLPTRNPRGRSELSLDVRFLNDIGKLEVRLDDKVVKSIPAADLGVEKSIRVPLDFGKHYTERKSDLVALTLALDGKPGFTAQIDNVSIPGLVRAPMDDDEALLGWKIDGSNGGSASIVDTTRFPVKIDVLPGKGPKTWKRGGALSVAMLSSAGLNAPEEIDRATIRLSGAPPKTTRDKKGGEQAACDAKDVNKDKLADLVCEIEADRLVIDEGDATLVLEASTTTAMPIRGTDTAKIEGKGKPRAAE